MRTNELVLLNYEDEVNKKYKLLFVACIVQILG